MDMRILLRSFGRMSVSKKFVQLWQHIFSFKKIINVKGLTLYTCIYVMFSFLKEIVAIYDDNSCRC